VLCAAGAWRAKSLRSLQDMSDAICPPWLGRVLSGMVSRCLSLRRQERLKHLTSTLGIKSAGTSLSNCASLLPMCSRWEHVSGSDVKLGLVSAYVATARHRPGNGVVTL
jgi:hypothetical protein